MDRIQLKFRHSRLPFIISQVLSAGATTGVAFGVAMAATVTVNTTSDNGDATYCELREAIGAIVAGALLLGEDRPTSRIHPTLEFTEPRP